jgi:hypothetical protein
MTVVGFTSLTLTDLPRARVLAETWRAAHPGWPLWAVLVDRPPQGFANRAVFAGFDAVVAVEALGIAHVLGWLFGQERAEARAAARGAMARHLLGLGARKVVYLAPEVAVFHPLASLATRDDAASVLLAPGDARGDGFLAIRNDATGLAFAEDWAARLRADPGAALATRAAVVRDPGWNPTERVLARHPPRFSANGNMRVDGAPLAFIRFAKPEPTGAAAELWAWHARRCAALAEPGLADDWWHFSQFSDGTPIPPSARRVARAHPDALAGFPDPFDCAGDSFRAWLAAQAPALPREAESPP